jgi:TPR repeat protein
VHTRETESASTRYAKPQKEFCEGIQVVHTTNNIIELPKPRDLRLDEAAKLCDARQFTAALICLTQLIDEGCDEAYYYAGRIYEEGGNGVQRDLAKAIFYYEKSTQEYGSVEGCLALGRLHYFGIGVVQDYRKAFEWLSRIADKTNNGRGHGVAQMMLGEMYAFGHGVQQNFAAAREYFQKAADQGYVFALSALSTLEWKSGNYLKSAKLRIKAIWAAFRVTWSDPNDYRLRRS